MEIDVIKIGILSKRLLAEFNLPSAKANVYVLRKTLDEFVNRFPNDYLIKISECKKILAHPFYATFDKERQILYLVKEYIEGDRFKKVAIEIDLRKQSHLIDLFVLNEKKIKSVIRKGMKWIIVNQRK